MTRRLALAAGMCLATYLLLILAGATAHAGQETNKPQPGLAVTFTSDDGKVSDVAVLSNVWLCVASGQPPTPFLPGGRFSAIWNGQLQLDLRGEYALQAELNGTLKLEVNGKVLSETNGTDILTAPSEFIRLNKGTNTIAVTYRSPTNGDSRLRLAWIPKGSLPAPLPSNALFHTPNEAEARSRKLRLGRELFVEYRCAKCHTSSESVLPEMAMDAPSFEGIGSRRNYEWMARWIADPKSLRAAAHMPKTLRGEKSKADAEAIAAYLASLKVQNPSALDEKATGHASDDKASMEQIETGRGLFEKLHRVACHNAPGASETDALKVPLENAREKFAPGALALFLLKPEEHYAWIRMPNFKLGRDEANALAGFLLSTSGKPQETPMPSEPALIDRGKRLVQTSGCLNCHSAKLENKFKTKPLADLASTTWNAGCLAQNLSDNTKAPHFGFVSEERAALAAFGATDRFSLARHVPAEFVERHTRLLNCTACHGKVEGFPTLDLLGGKLRPEWTKAFLAGEVTYKPRPWLEARMPAFPSRAVFLARGLAAQHGYPAQTAAEPPLDTEAAKVGQRLVSAEGGFACIACHAVGKVAATQVFESAGINLAYSESRLLRPFFDRWLRNPLAVDPSTKMPVYFDEEGKSPLTDYYEGDGAQQIEAMWQYIRLGEKMPPPPGTEPTE